MIAQARVTDTRGSARIVLPPTAAKAVEAGERALAEGRDVELPPDVPKELLGQLNIRQSVSAVEDPSDQGQTTVRKINIVLDKGAGRPTARQPSLRLPNRQAETQQAGGADRLHGSTVNHPVMFMLPPF